MACSEEEEEVMQMSPVVWTPKCQVLCDLSR